MGRASPFKTEQKQSEDRSARYAKEQERLELEQERRSREYAAEYGSGAAYAPPGGATYAPITGGAYGSDYNGGGEREEQPVWPLVANPTSQVQQDKQAMPVAKVLSMAVGGLLVLKLAETALKTAGNVLSSAVKNPAVIACAAIAAGAIVYRCYSHKETESQAKAQSGNPSMEDNPQHFGYSR